MYDHSREQVSPSGAYGAATGMTLRDYFAAKAMQGLLADPPAALIRLAEQEHKSIADTYAHEAYVYADAMLKARAK